MEGETNSGVYRREREIETARGGKGRIYRNWDSGTRNLSLSGGADLSEGGSAIRRHRASLEEAIWSDPDAGRQPSTLDRVTEGR